MVDLICRRCGKTFLYENRRAHYCAECKPFARKETQARASKAWSASVQHLNNEMYELQCHACGELFKSPSYRRRLCPACKEASGKRMNSVNKSIINNAHSYEDAAEEDIRRRAKARAKRTQAPIAEAAKEARKRCLSYGQLMAMRFDAERLK